MGCACGDPINSISQSTVVNAALALHEDCIRSLRNPGKYVLCHEITIAKFEVDTVNDVGWCVSQIILE